MNFYETSKYVKGLLWIYKYKEASKVGKEYVCDKTKLAKYLKQWLGEGWQQCAIGDLFWSGTE